MRTRRGERAGAVPVIFISLLLHLALLYPLANLEGRAETRQPGSGALVAYLELREDEPEGAAAGHQAGAGEASNGERAATPAAPAVAAGPAPAGEVRSPPAVPSVEAPQASNPPPSAFPEKLTGGFTGPAVPHAEATARGEAGGKGGGAAAGARSAASGSSGAAKTPAAGSEGSPAGSYLASLRRLIEARKSYPPAARRAGREGSCRRRFFLSRDGTLREVEAVTSCGHPFLDAAASRAISSVGNFPPVPGDLSTEEPFEVTITFALEGR